MSKYYMVEINIGSVTEETSLDDIAEIKMIHRNCGGGKIVATWGKTVASHRSRLLLDCKRCGIERKLDDTEALRYALTDLLFKGEAETKQYEGVTFIPVGKKD